MSVAERIYRRMPIPVQSGLITLKGAQFAWERYGSEYRAYKVRIPGILSLSPEELQLYQLTEVRRLVDYAKAQSPFYARTLAGISPDSIRSLDDLQTLPVLEKEDLRTHCHEIYTVGAKGAIESHTGGTTGKSLAVRFTRRDFQHRMAELDFFREVHGARHRMRRASFSGKHIVYEEDIRADTFWRTNWVLNQRFYSTFHLAPTNLQRYVDNLNEFKPQILDGFTSCMVDLCNYVKQTGQEFAFRPVAIFPTSEPLYGHQRAVLKECLGVEPRDQYASSEGAPFITECILGRLHYQVHTGVIEADENGDALVTSFSTYGTPLIRYRVGDRMTFREGMCSCGWNTPLVERIEGRAIDYLVSPERGRIYSPNMANVVKDLPGSIVQTQFVQRSPTTIRVNIVVDRQRFIEQHTEAIVEQVRRRLGASIEVEVARVPAIERAASGKQRFIVNELVQV